MNSAAAQQEAIEFLREWERRPQHVFHVAGLALQLFDELAPLHGLGPEERVMLEAAALLHDIGRASKRGATEHHLESARLIREKVWAHFTPAQVEVIAQVARYHRKSPPQSDQAELTALSSEDQRRVIFLGALLRIADGLDRTHEGMVWRVRPEVSPTQIVFHLSASRDAIRELEGAERKSDLARTAFQRDIVFILEPDAG